jgi:hypothetical protein
MEWKAVAANNLAESEPRYHLLQDDNGAVTVNVYTGDDREVSSINFDSRETALNWIRVQRRI